MTAYVGVFAEQLANFLAVKQALGFAYTTEAAELLRFSRFTVTWGVNEPILTREVVQAWNARRPHEGLRNNGRRVSVLRQFSLYLNTLGADVYVAPPHGHIRHCTFTPYIFTHDEVERIFTYSDRLYPHRGSAMPYVMPVLLRLLYGCGLRISEAVRLSNQDVDLQGGVLAIKNSKCGKDRQLPMAPSLLGICRAYSAAIHRRSSGSDYFFMKANHQPITRDNVYRRFREILWATGISHGGKGVGPRLHDLRHTFAVHSLKRAVDRQLDVYCALPVLSSYLGHASVTATEQYVRLTAEVFPEIGAALDRTCAGVIPEVTGG